MAKFKRGDRVRLNASADMAEYGLAPGDVGTVMENAGAPFVMWDKLGDDWAISENEANLIESNSPSETTGPVRTVTRKEIAPGRYGYLTWRQVDASEVGIDADGNFTAKDLREAAAIMVELADALDFNARAAA